MLPEATLLSYINKAITKASNAASFEAACKATPAFINALCNNLDQHKLEYTIHKYADKPFDEINVNLVEEKWQHDFWWGQAYLSVKISKLAPVFTAEKIMIQLDHNVSNAEVNAWQHLAAEREVIIENILNNYGVTNGFSKLSSSELSQGVDTGSLELNSHYRKWKPTIHAVFFEKIT